VNESHVLKYGSDETVTVTPIDANHCPGAAMFLFEGHFGHILYTGDFRYCPQMLNDFTRLSQYSCSIDVLYLDNTFCDPRCIFPSREDAIIEMLSIIRSHPNARIKIGLRNLGKEVMLVNIAHSIGEWIGVSRDRYDVLELLEMPRVFMVSPSCRIQVVMMSEITGKNMTDWNDDHETVAIIPTGLSVAVPWSAFPQRDDVHVVLYSDHSSYKELQQFVSLIEPRKIHPILGSNLKDRLAKSLPSRADMSCFKLNVDNADQECANEHDVALLRGLESASSACVTSLSEPDIHTTQFKPAKTKKRSGGFTIKKKMRMGVVFSSSQSLEKRPEHEPGQLVVTAADSGGIIAELSEPDSDIDAATSTNGMCFVPGATACDTTTVNNYNEEDQRSVQSNNCPSLRQDDRELVYRDNAEDDQQCVSGHARSALSFESVDSAWMLQVLQPLISKEADKLISEHQSSFKLNQK